MTDYGSTAYAQARRETKAVQLEVELGVVRGLTSVTAAALTATERRAVERAAGLSRAASDETWARAFALMRSWEDKHPPKGPTPCATSD